MYRTPAWPTATPAADDDAKRTHSTPGKEPNKYYDRPILAILSRALVFCKVVSHHPSPRTVITNYTLGEYLVHWTRSHEQFASIPEVILLLTLYLSRTLSSFRITHSSPSHTLLLASCFLWICPTAAAPPLVVTLHPRPSTRRQHATSIFT